MTRLAMLLSLVAAALAAGGCAGGLRDAAGNPMLERATPEQIARATPVPVPRLTAEDLVRMSQAGEPPGAIIERIRQTRTRFGLSASQTIELARRGVDRSVLDYIVKADQEAARTDAADAIARRDAEAAALRAERDRLRAAPYYYGPYYADPRWGGYYGYGYRGSRGGLWLGF